MATARSPARSPWPAGSLLRLSPRAIDVAQDAPVPVGADDRRRRRRWRAGCPARTRTGRRSSRRGELKRSDFPRDGPVPPPAPSRSRQEAGDDEEDQRHGDDQHDQQDDAHRPAAHLQQLGRTSLMPAAPCPAAAADWAAVARRRGTRRRPGGSAAAAAAACVIWRKTVSRSLPGSGRRRRCRPRPAPG